MNEGHSKYLQFSKLIRRINKRYKLTESKQVMVLEAVLCSHAEKTSISVLNLILMNEIASQATLHSITKVLINLRLIKTEVAKDDARRKYVIPTKLGLEWLAECTDALVSITKK
jgi:DNA-binding MarR family transcriptional regulator